MRVSSTSANLTDSAFAILRDLIHDRTGLHYENGNRELLAGKLADRLRECGFESFLDYCANLLAPAEIADLAVAEVIFCRNVFIYFSEPAIKKTVKFFGQRTPAPAYLFTGEMSDELIAKVKAAASIRQLHALPRARGAPPRVRLNGAQRAGRVDIVVLGISTGGPQALKFLVPQLPADFPVPLAVVLHMPVGYTELYARSLNESSSLEVREARDGDAFGPGTVLIAPAGHHLSLRRENRKVLTHLDTRPFDTPHRPAVDVLFRSAADVFGERVLGVVMTGMGSDGKQGAAWIKAQGGHVFTEAEETCVVYGMPRSVVEAGLSDRSVPLQEMAQAIMEVV